MLVAPSPKSQSHATIPSYDVEASVKSTVNGSSPLVGVPEKSAVGSVSAIAAVVVFVSGVPSLSVTVRVTV
uniref:Uncharacterized protein n=1 Tax=Candidatus Methanophagaceae archaeon ANME-1 ERB6 TaxID=2759912 RepID=A0A7G9YYH8_9EURY|nr:hypothetical protein GGECLBBC_00001 [Methanosarcinales archaeon ANME-1 ERB6]